MPIAIYFENEYSPQMYHEQPIGRGAKGEVYRSVDGRYVFKRLFDQRMSLDDIEGHRQRLRLVCDQFNVVRQHPYWSELFAWPDKVAVRMDNTPCLGVRMAYVGLDSMHNPIEMFASATGYRDLETKERGWWIARVAICMKLARAVAYLDRNNLAHTDISGRNVYGDVFTGRMKLIDCDGIVAPGTELRAQVGGTIDYMAPELVSRDEPFPSLLTDRHALAVFIYRTLLYLHPLRGPRNFPGTPEEADRRMFGRDALYIDHPHRHENRRTGRTFSTEALGARMHELFQRAFVTGLHEPRLRPTASEWEDALTRLYGRIIPCSNPRCAQRYFAAPETPGELRCTWCNKETRGPASLLYMRLQRFTTIYSNLFQEMQTGYEDDDYVIVGWPGRTLHEWHLSTRVSPVPAAGRVYDPSPVASFHYDIKNNRWYLRNERATQMKFVSAREPVAPGRTLPLDDGHQIYLGVNEDARLATVIIASAQKGEAIHQLPEEDISPQQPWPTLHPSQPDKTWTLGNAISLPTYRGVSMANRPRSSSGRLLLPMLFFAVLGALLGGGWLALLTFWIVLSHAAIALGGVVLGMALQWWFGRRRAEGYWVILIIVLLAPAVLGLLSDPLYAGVGAIAGAVVGLILGIVNRVRLARE